MNDTELLYNPSIFFTKLAILSQLLLLFVVHRNFVYWTCHTLIWFLGLFYAALMLTALFACLPRAKIWDSTVPGTCVNANVGILVTTPINAITDIVILIIPIACVWRLQMDDFA